MKLIPVVLIVVLAVSSEVLCESESRSQAESASGENLVSRPIPQRFNPVGWVSSIWNTIPSLSDFISRFVPDAGEIFSMTKNALIGTPARVVASYIDRVCRVASTIGIKQNYAPDLTDFELQLYTANHVVSAPLHDPSGLLESPQYNPDFNVTVFVTGWQSVVGDALGYNPVGVMKSAYVHRGGHNFIVFDAGKFVSTLYRWATLDVLHVGMALGNALASMYSKVPASNIHLIGHGVGAHIVGVAAKRFTGSTEQLVYRITALDPASPCVNQNFVLSRDDAQYVDVIHTNSGVLGKRDAFGDVDFYPNGPVPLPPGCNNVICAHYRAVDYYAESVHPGSEDNFMAVKCGSIDEYNNNKCHGKRIPMGYAVPTYAKGMYYVQTNSASPYGQNSE